jgi:hypothetical protein
VNGSDLTPEDGAITVLVHVVAPSEKKVFNGTVKVVNMHNLSDVETISVYMKTPVDLVSMKSQLVDLIKNFLERSPLFHHLMKLMT